MFHVDRKEVIRLIYSQVSCALSSSCRSDIFCTHKIARERDRGNKVEVNKSNYILTMCLAATILNQFLCHSLIDRPLEKRRRRLPRWIYAALKGGI